MQLDKVTNLQRNNRNGKVNVPLDCKKILYSKKMENKKNKNKKHREHTQEFINT